LKLCFNMLAMVATQLLRMILPVSASASSSRSRMSARGTYRPRTARISSRLLTSGKTSRARPEKAPAKSCRIATRLLSSLSTFSTATTGGKISHCGTESRTSCLTIPRRLVAARAIATLASSQSASCSTSARGAIPSVAIDVPNQANGVEREVRPQLAESRWVPEQRRERHVSICTRESSGSASVGSCPTHYGTSSGLPTSSTASSLPRIPPWPLPGSPLGSRSASRRAC
jgi:hypothetical protein